MRDVARPRLAPTPYWLCAPVLALLGVLLIVPLAMTFLLSFDAYSDSKGIIDTWTLANYAEVVGDPYFGRIFLRTFRVALVTTIACAAIGTPEAYVLSRIGRRWQSLCLVAVLGPLLVSVVVRTLGWQILLARNGLVNEALAATGLIRRPLDLLFTETGMDIAMTHFMVPYMVVAVWTALRQIDPRTEHAALSLSASSITVFRRVTLPMLLAGLAGGFILAFTASFDELTVTIFVSSPQVTPLSVRLFNHISQTVDPLVASVSVVIMALTTLLLIALDRIYGVDRLFGGAR